MFVCLYIIFIKKKNVLRKLLNYFNRNYKYSVENIIVKIIVKNQCFAIDIFLYSGCKSQHVIKDNRFYDSSERFWSIK